MTFLLDVSDSRELNQQFEAYQSYLRSVEGKLETNAFAFASALWHYDAQDPRCPHDSWIESIKVVENATGDRHQHRWIDIHVRLLGAYHDGHIELTYTNVRSYSLGASDVGGHGDWLRDEIRLSDEGLALHEVRFASGSRWSIECRDIQYDWVVLT